MKCAIPRTCKCSVARVVNRATEVFSSAAALWRSLWRWKPPKDALTPAAAAQEPQSGLDELTRPTTRDLISPARRLWTFRRFARPSIHVPAPLCMTALSSIGLGFFCFLDSSNAPRLPLLRWLARRFSPTRVWVWGWTPSNHRSSTTESAHPPYIDRASAAAATL